ncbi:MAG: glycosyltransferase, partial [Clostridia bacterium]|nr:glycosyltransferase [Clostridia bacterium]
IISELKKHTDKIYYVGSEKGVENEIIKKEGIKYYSVPCCKLRRTLALSNLLIPVKLAQGIIKARKILKEIAPDVIFSKGGYVALPVVMAGASLGIPVVTHESDFSVGLANKISSRFSACALTSFKTTAEKLKHGEYSGPPIKSGLIRKDKAELMKEFSFDENKPVLLVFGGSLGSMVINRVLRETLDIRAK